VHCFLASSPPRARCGARGSGARVHRRVPHQPTRLFISPGAPVPRAIFPRATIHMLPCHAHDCLSPRARRRPKSLLACRGPATASLAEHHVRACLAPVQAAQHQSICSAPYQAMLLPLNEAWGWAWKQAQARCSGNGVPWQEAGEQAPLASTAIERSTGARGRLIFTAAGPSSWADHHQEAGHAGG
jgi:hypothetical protein